ncbi:MAG: putative Elongation factor 1-alpha [Streblomastix strix]|uniref:Putative Elongation factor 1-alpha n=1 Tax=Streblomastix strix TaxID=222440 RepID=A0A5J4W998_9EUKA|nr:MAG: putative Elongation factor 1-alpha [Streblomastix strix]
MGVQKLIFTVNNMDEIQWNNKKYIAIIAEIGRFAQNIGFKYEDCIFIPISEKFGDNLIDKSKNQESSCGPSLIELILTHKTPEIKIDEPFLMRIDKIEEENLEENFDITLFGKIESGIIKEGDSLLIQPGLSEIKVQSIICNENKLQIAIPGDLVEIGFQDVDDSLPKIDYFEAQFSVLKCENIISAGFYCVVFANNTQVEGIITVSLIKINFQL